VDRACTWPTDRHRWNNGTGLPPAQGNAITQYISKPQKSDLNRMPLPPLWLRTGEPDHA
jgi:hypothetical protein